MGMAFPRAVALSLLALVFTGLNALKPYVIDDRAYHYYAVEFASHPQAPYSFHFHPKNIPANNLLVPPVLPYWLALTAAQGPEDPFIWKLWLFPFVLLWTFSIHFLYRRFAPGCAMGLVALTLFSPTFLPALNLMLDIPALALALGALVCYLRGTEIQQWTAGFGLTLLSGILAGLATQTKYTAFVAVAAIALHSMLFRYPWRGLVIGAAAVSMFVSWEVFVAGQQGQSHFLINYHQRSPRLLSKFNQIAPALGILGGLTSGLILLGASALGWTRRWPWALLVFLTIGLLLLAVVPDSSAVFSYHPRTGMPLVSLKTIFFGVLGTLFGSIVCRAIIQLASANRSREEKLADLFLIAWLVFEILGAFALSPFQAARRWLGAIVVATILLGRLLVLTSRPEWLNRQVLPAFMCSTLLGCLLYAVDFAEGDSEKRACAWALDYAQQHGTPLTWYVSDGSSFHYYAEEAGVPFWNPALQTPRPGDWILMALRTDEQWPGMRELRNSPHAHLIEEKDFGDTIPYQMQQCYYGGAGALEHHEGARVKVKLFRWE